MSATGGDIVEISIAGRLFPVAGDSDAALMIGGKKASIEVNGDGTARTILINAPWSVGSVPIVIDDNRGDQEFLQEKIDSGQQQKIGVTLVNNVTWAGQGTIVDDFSRSTKSATSTVTLSGGGKLEQQ